MKTKLSFVLVAFLLASINLNAQKMQAWLSYSTFNSPTGPYIETYLSIGGKNIAYTQLPNKKFQAKIEVTIMFKKDTTVCNFDKYQILSPEIDDTMKIASNYLNLKRFALKNGKYSMEIILKDLNKNSKPIRSIDTLEINYPNDKLGISGIEFVESIKKTEKESEFSKNGFDLIPYPYDFLPKNMKEIYFYAEIYNTDKGEIAENKFLIKSYIKSFETQKVFNQKQIIKKGESKPVNVVLNSFDISDVPSGNYELVIDIVNKDNQVIATNSYFFQRSNPDLKFNSQDLKNINVRNTFVSNYTSKDTLREYINWLYPISTTLEKNYADNLILSDSIDIMQKYFYNFWQNRYPLNPQLGWNNYKAVVEVVNVKFKTNISGGYETDRGRIYLHYGAPNSVSTGDGETSTLPYEIWHYYTLNNGQRNKRFVFYNPSLTNNDFELLHSDVIGEMNNPNWSSLIRNTKLFKIDEYDKTENDNIGEKLREQFKRPR